MQETPTATFVTDVMEYATGEKLPCTIASNSRLCTVTAESKMPSFPLNPGTLKHPHGFEVHYRHVHSFVSDECKLVFTLPATEAIASLGHDETEALLEAAPWARNSMLCKELRTTPGRTLMWWNGCNEFYTNAFGRHTDSFTQIGRLHRDEVFFYIALRTLYAPAFIEVARGVDACLRTTMTYGTHSTPPSHAYSMTLEQVMRQMLRKDREQFLTSRHDVLARLPDTVASGLEDLRSCAHAL